MTHDHDAAATAAALDAHEQALEDPTPDPFGDAIAEELREELDLPALRLEERAEAHAIANRHLWALKHVRGEMLNVAGQLRATIDLFTQQAERRIEALRRREHYLEGILERVYDAFPPTGKARSVALLGGRIGLRTSPARWTVEDQEAATAAAIAGGHDDLVTEKVERRLSSKALNAYMGTKGRTPFPGTKHIPSRAEFYAKPE